MNSSIHRGSLVSAYNGFYVVVEVWMSLGQVYVDAVREDCDDEGWANPLCFGIHELVPVFES